MSRIPKINVRFVGAFEQLAEIVARTRIAGRWEYMPANYVRYVCTDRAILNWWPTTGTIDFQGPLPAKRNLISALALGSSRRPFEVLSVASTSDGESRPKTEAPLLRLAPGESR